MKQFDAIILGAGINGVSIARELQLRGKSVLVLEKRSIGSGSSSKSSKLVHGGLRYLENLEISLVHEALKDRTYLVNHYPELVHLEPFYLPIKNDSSRSPFKIRCGLALYDLLSFNSFGLDRSSNVSLMDFFHLFPRLDNTKIQAVFRYYDAKTNDLELTRQFASEAMSSGAVIVEGTTIDRIDRGETHTIIEAGNQSYCTQALINATGPWVDEVNQEFQLPSRFRIQKVSGIHIEIESVLLPSPVILQTESERIFFMIPSNNRLTIGTTERSEIKECDEITINEKDIDYLIKEANRYFRKPISKDDIVDQYIGVRPIVHSQHDVTKSSREYKLDLHKKGANQLLHVFGGKLTTSLSLARKVAKRLSL
jgi:glycerol-3-phosphate dehydrogenase